MAFELDHVFIWTDIGAYEAECLVSSGLVEGTSNTHPGQGTANRRFFFHKSRCTETMRFVGCVREVIPNPHLKTP